MITNLIKEHEKETVDKWLKFIFSSKLNKTKLSSEDIFTNMSIIQKDNIKILNVLYVNMPLTTKRVKSTCINVHIILKR